MSQGETLRAINDRLRAAFHGVADIGNEASCPVRIEDKIFSPPSYMVRLVLRAGGFAEYGPEDKVAWLFYLRYKDVNFEVRDWKMSTWTIEADQGSPKALEAANELKRKILNAAQLVNRVLQQDL